MIITKNIVFLNLPKTGSSFVRKVIKSIYNKRMNRNIFYKFLYRIKILKPPYKELLLPNIKFNHKVNHPKGQHGVYIQIPEEDRKKEIVSIVRNPYYRFLSTFEYRFWQDRPVLNKDILEKHLPNFPNLNIKEFIEYHKLLVKYTSFDTYKDIKIGIASVQFINFFFKDPDKVLNSLTKEYIESDTLFLKDIADITFLKQENLKEELIGFLRDKYFSNDELNFIKNHPKVNVTTKNYENRETLLTKEVIEYINEYEYFYFNVLKQYGINYFKK